MKALWIDYSVYDYPDGCENIDDFIIKANNNYNSFNKVRRYKDDSCCEPYYIAEDTEEVYLNVSHIQEIRECQIQVLSKEEYRKRLTEIVASKCVHCSNYRDHAGDENLEGHWTNINLDGKCNMYEPEKE
jgi:hypothetical protein